MDSGKEDQSWTVVKVVKTDYNQEKKGQYRTGLNSKDNNESGASQPRRRLQASVGRNL